MKIPSSVLIDTNVLLTACAPQRQSHEKALEVLKSWPNKGVRLALSGQILREYLGVATRPTSRNGLGLELGDALSNCKALASRCQVLEESRSVSENFLEIVRKTKTSGKQLHDANLVATALIHDVSDILTQNVEDFRRFDSMVGIIEL